MQEVIQRDQFMRCLCATPTVVAQLLEPNQYALVKLIADAHGVKHALTLF